MMRSDRRSNKVMVLEIVEEELAAEQKKKVLKGYHPTAEEKNEKRGFLLLSVATLKSLVCSFGGAAVRRLQSENSQSTTITTELTVGTTVQRLRHDFKGKEQKMITRVRSK
jgi:hypothetical protein